MPYVQRDEAGNIVLLFGALAPMFQQARTYLSTHKLQERLSEYPAIHEEAARLGVSFDEAVGHADDIQNPDKRWTICGRWPEWIDESDEDSHADNEGSGDVGSSDLALDDPSGDLGEAEAFDHPDAPDFSDDAGEPDPANSGGVLIQEGTRTETILMNLRETPLRLVRDYYESRLTYEIGDENARQALHIAGTEDEFRDEKLAWVAAMDATLQEKLQAIQDETDPMALVNYRSEADGWPAPSVEVVEYEQDEI